MHSKTLQAVEIVKLKNEEFSTRQHKDVDGTRIYAGKKNEVVLMDVKLGNLAGNNSRNIFSQVTGITIFDSNDGGLQLNIGGRGLNPNRTANFNTRQNNYDISADVLGYPESYYTPPAEALDEIQIVKGAASLQYGTQFGGLINFKLKNGTSRKSLELIFRNSVSSFDTHSSFLSASGNVKNTQYISFFNYKEGNGPQENSNYHSRNFFARIEEKLSPNTKISAEITKFNYLAHQPGITDKMFYEDPYQSIRSRNWFRVDWNLYSASLNHQFNEKLLADFMIFGLDAERQSLGYRPRKVAERDFPTAACDLISGEYKIIGAEAKLLFKYGKRDHALLLGSKFYSAKNTSHQGAGMDGAGPDFRFNSDLPNYFFQSSYQYPNQNVAVFAEHIFRLTDAFSINPGVQWENIKTGATGSYRRIIEDNAGNPLLNELTEENETRKRNFLLAGVGISYKPLQYAELYANISQNYRSVTFSDIRVDNNSQIIDPNIKDETGYTGDKGARERWKNWIKYDLNIFSLIYNNKIDNVFRKRNEGFAEVIRTRNNVGTAWIRGLESYVEFDFANILGWQHKPIVLNGFINYSYTKANYTKSEIPGIKGNIVEYVPTHNLKNGLNMGYKNLIAGLLLSHISKQYTSANNKEQDPEDNTWGIRGSIPSYTVADINLSYMLNGNIKI